MSKFLNISKIIAGILVAAFIIGGCIMLFIKNDNKGHVKIKKKPKKIESISKNEYENTIKITALGNILFHEKQLLGAKTKDGYDFSPSFEYIKSAISGSDITIGTLETTLGGKDFTGYPIFNSPDEVLPALKNIGVNVVNYANNHILDKGSFGFFRTLKTTKDNNIDMVGVRNNASEKRYFVKDVKWQKIGIIGYTFETQKKKNMRTINGLIIPNDVNGLINTFNYGELNEFYSDLNSNIEEMKKDGANFIMVDIHWGDEYSTSANVNQKNMAKKLSEMGVDIILGNHPHVIEPYEIITNSKGKKTFVVYSQGNFISNQCTEERVTNNENTNYKTEDGTIINFILSINDGRLSIKEYNVIPIWVYREPKNNGLFIHRVIPINDALKNKAKFNIIDSEYSNIQRSLIDTKTTLGTNGLGNYKFPDNY